MDVSSQIKELETRAMQVGKYVLCFRRPTMQARRLLRFSRNTLLLLLLASLIGHTTRLEIAQMTADELVNIISPSSSLTANSRRLHSEKQ